MVNGTPAAVLLKRTCERLGLKLRELHRQVNQRKDINVELTTLQYYWGEGAKFFKGDKLPVNKPFLRATREVLMAHGATDNELLAIFGPLSADDGSVQRDIFEIRVALSDLAQEVHDIKALLLSLRAQVPSGGPGA